MAKRREIWAILLIFIAGLMIAAPAAAATTELHIVKYASDGSSSSGDNQDLPMA
jgi:archaellum component FlaG (FlaF/FlaG flagellin family)